MSLPHILTRNDRWSTLSSAVTTAVTALKSELDPSTTAGAQTVVSVLQKRATGMAVMTDQPTNVDLGTVLTQLATVRGC